MKPELSMRLFSRQPLSTCLAEKQIRALAEFYDGHFQPERWAPYEPIRKVFDPADISEAVAQLSRPAGTFMYRRVKPPRVSGVIWNLSHPEFIDDAVPLLPEPMFLNYWTAEFGLASLRSEDVSAIQKLFLSLFKATQADFGLLTPTDDLDAKNYQVVSTPSGGRSLSYVGLDPSRGVPGLYWVNLFSPALARWLELGRFLARNPQSGEERPDVTVLKFGVSPDLCNSPRVLQSQQDAIESLGTWKFFDIHHPDRVLEPPKWAEEKGTAPA